MVRLYLPPRFSKRRMALNVADKALKMFGGPTMFRNTKVVHSAAVYMNKDEQMF